MSDTPPSPSLLDDIVLNIIKEKKTTYRAELAKAQPQDPNYSDPTSDALQRTIVLGWTHDRSQIEADALMNYTPPGEQAIGFGSFLARLTGSVYHHC